MTDQTIHERAEAICLSLRTLAGDNSRVDSAAMREAADLIRELSKMVREREGHIHGMLVLTAGSQFEGHGAFRSARAALKGQTDD